MWPTVRPGLVGYVQIATCRSAKHSAASRQFYELQYDSRTNERVVQIHNLCNHRYVTARICASSMARIVSYYYVKVLNTAAE